MSDNTSQDYLKEAEEELYTALKALQDGDLPFARSSAMRAANRVTDAHQAGRRGILDMSPEERARRGEPSSRDVIIERSTRSGVRNMIDQLADTE